jgi:hypothetical protein
VSVQESVGHTHDLVNQKRTDLYQQIRDIYSGVTEYVHPIYDIDMAARLGQVSAALIVNS